MPRTQTMLIAALGTVLVGVDARQSAPEEGAPEPWVARLNDVQPAEAGRPMRLAHPAAPLQPEAIGTVLSHGEDDDQPAGDCWIVGVIDASRSCLCSAGSVEDVLTPDFMRVLLTTWRDAGRLTTGEWRERLHEVDAACSPTAIAP